MALPVITDQMDEDELEDIMSNAYEASKLLKAISHEGRLKILCHLLSGEKSVAELEDLLHQRQAAVSQQLSRLRIEGLIRPRRDGKATYYSLSDERPRKVLDVLYGLYCVNGHPAQQHEDAAPQARSDSPEIR